MNIAVIGMSIRLPASDTPWQLHHILSRGESVIKHFGIPRLDWIGARGLIEKTDWFDAERFRIAEAEAGRMDPQHRLVLEESIKAMESAGYTIGNGSLNCGVFASCSANFRHLQSCLQDEGDDVVGRYKVLLNNDKDFLATRVAWHLDLTGPAMSVQSGCSSSLLALHQACQALRNGECSIALVAAASLTLPLEEGYPVSEGMIFSPTGLCNPYTDKANGTVGGTGVIVLVLQRLTEALSEGAPCWGVIRGSAVNNDGRNKVSFTAPGIDQQIAVMRQALSVADISAEEVGYIEGHGTGTFLGDSIELAALTEVYGKKHDSLPSLGSIKANIGHLDAASGLAGVVKCLLSLSNHVIYPQPGLNDAVAQTVFPLQDELVSWSTSNAFAAVTSLGIGGTNVHMLLSSPPERLLIHSADPVWIPLSAYSEDGIRLLARYLLEATENSSGKELFHYARTLQHRYEKSNYSHHCNLQVNDWQHWLFQLNLLSSGALVSEMHYHTSIDALNHLSTLYRVPLPATPLNSRPLHSAQLTVSMEPQQIVEESTFDSPVTLITSEWRKIFGSTEVISIHTHFFEEGGDSLLALQLVQALKKKGLVTVSIVDLYEAPQLGNFIRRLTKEKVEDRLIDVIIDDENWEL